MAGKKEGSQGPKNNTSGITKLEAVRRGLAALGKDAKPLQIKDFVEKEFGIEMSADHISTYKGTILKKAGRGKPASSKPVVMSSVAQAHISPQPKPAGTISKMDAVRKALAKLGKGAKPIDLQSYVKEQFGIEMSADHCSNYKGVILRTRKRKGKSVAVGKPVATVSAAQTIPAALAKNHPAPAIIGNGKSTAISLGDIETVHGLLGRVGPESLRHLIDLLAK